MKNEIKQGYFTPRYLIAMGAPITMLLVIAIIALSNISDKINFINKELAGADDISTLSNILFNLQDIRLLSIKNNKRQLSPGLINLQDDIKQQTQAFITKFEATNTIDTPLSIRKFGSELNLTIKEHQVLGTTEHTFERYTRLIHSGYQAIKNIANNSHLILDHELDSYTLVILATDHIPLLNERIFRTDAQSQYVVDNQFNLTVPSDAAASIQQWLHNAIKTAEILEADIEILAEKHHKLKAKLSEFSGIIIKKLGVLDTLMNEFVLSTSNLDMNSQTQRINQIKKELKTAISSFKQQVNHSLEVILNTRKVQLQQNQILIGGLTLFGIVIIIYFLTIFHLKNRENLLAAQRAVEKQISTQSRLESILNTAASGIIIIEKDGTMQSFNTAAERLFGYKAHEAIGQNVSMLMPHSFEIQHDQFLENHNQTGVNKIIGIGREVEGQRKNGSTFPIDLAIGKVEVNGEMIFSGIINDISERKNAETRLQSILNTIAAGVLTIDKDGIIQSFNHAAESLFAYPANMAIGKHIATCLPEASTASQDYEFINKHLNKTIGNSTETVGLRQDGSHFPVDLIFGEMDINGQKMYSGIVIDASERKEIERVKTEFISSISHDLRTPLTSISGSLKLMLGGTTGELPEKAQKLLQISSDNSDRLIRLINDFLDLKKIETGQMDFIFAPCDIIELINTSVVANKSYAEKYDVTYEFVNHPEHLEINIDSDRIIQVMDNLLSNAAKYSNKGGNIEINAGIINNVIRVSVTDHGDGIPLDFQNKIFGKFSQSTTEKTRNVGGSGLGLSICKLITEKHHGQIGFESTPGNGSTFFFDLPIQQQHSSAA